MNAKPTPWKLKNAVRLCTKIEAVCPRYGCHVALTGGLLYKAGARKDCDIVFYRVRQVPEIDIDGLLGALAALGLVHVGGFGWCHKFEYKGRPVDCFFPEEQGGEYNPDLHAEISFDADLALP